MSYKQKKQRRSIHLTDHQINPILGLLDEDVTLCCQVNSQFQTHKYLYSYSHPLQCITKLISKRKKQTFQKLLAHSDINRIILQNVFFPKELLSGNLTIMSTFKKQLQKSKINSYIKLHLNENKFDFNHKRSTSCELTKSIFNSKESKLKSMSVQKKYENYQEIQQNQIYKTIKQFESPICNKQKQNKVYNSRTKQFSLNNVYTSKTIINQKKKSKTKPLNINVSYTVIQNNVDNPESSVTFQKAFTSKNQKLKDQKIKKQFCQQSLKVPSPNKYQNSRTQGQFIATYHDEILSERMNRSVKNSEMSQLTHEDNEVYYFQKEKKYTKKERRVFQEQRHC